jgi:hypothetical protein
VGLEDAREGRTTPTAAAATATIKHTARKERRRMVDAIESIVPEKSASGQEMNSEPARR